MKKTFNTNYGNIITKDVMIDVESCLEEGIDLSDSDGIFITSIIGLSVDELDAYIVEDLVEYSNNFK